MKMILDEVDAILRKSLLKMEGEGRSLKPLQTVPTLPPHNWSIEEIEELENMKTVEVPVLDEDMAERWVDECSREDLDNCALWYNNNKKEC